MNTELMCLAETLEYSWSAEVLLHNENIISIWYTAFPSMKNHMIKEIVSIYSDLPKHRIYKGFLLSPHVDCDATEPVNCPYCENELSDSGIECQVCLMNWSNIGLII